MVFQKTLQLYFQNFKLSIIFGILLVFVLFFLGFSNTFASSGSIFLDYSFLKESPLLLLLELLGFIAFTALYAVFLTLVVFSVRKELSSVRLNFYLREMIQKFSVKLFVFLLFFSLLLATISTLLVSAGVSPSIIVSVLFLVSIAFLFTPQSIVVDEKGIPQSVYYNFNFIAKKFPHFLLVLFTSAVMLAIIPFIELFLDGVTGNLGRFFTLALVLIFYVPFIEVLKTQLYMRKFGMIEGALDFEARMK